MICDDLSPIFILKVEFISMINGKKNKVQLFVQIFAFPIGEK